MSVLNATPNQILGWEKADAEGRYRQREAPVTKGCLSRDAALKWLNGSQYKDRAESFWSGFEFGAGEYEDEEPYVHDPGCDRVGADREAWLEGYECGHFESPRNREGKPTPLAP